MLKIEGGRMRLGEIRKELKEKLNGAHCFPKAKLEAEINNESGDVLCWVLLGATTIEDENQTLYIDTAMGGLLLDELLSRIAVLPDDYEVCILPFERYGGYQFEGIEFHQETDFTNHNVELSCKLVMRVVEEK